MISHLLRHRVFFVALVFLLWGWSGIVVAEEASKAQQSYSEGYALFQKKDYAKALQHFQKALRLSPSDAKHKNFQVAMHYFIGMCHFHLGQLSKAKSHLTRYNRSKLSRLKMRRQAQEVLGQIKRTQRKKAKVVSRRKPQQRAKVAESPSTEPQQPTTTEPVAERPALPLAKAPEVGRETPPSATRPLAADSKSLTTNQPKPPVPKSAPESDSTKKEPTRRRVAVVTMPPSVPPPKSGPSIASYLLLGAGIVAAVTGIVFGGLALNNDAQSAAIYKEGPQSGKFASEVIGLKNEAGTQAVVSYVTIGTGGALALTGLILLFTTGKR